MPEPQQTHADVPDGWEVVAHAPAPPPPSAGHDFKVFGVNVHVPAEEKPRADANLVGWGSSGSGIAPEDALAGGMAVKGIASAAKAGGALAGAKAAVTQATPVVKYEMTKGLLEAMGVPAAIAIPTAMVISGYKRGAASAEGAAARPSEVPPAGVDRYMPNQSGYEPPATPAAGRPGTMPAPAASGAPSGPPSAPAPPPAPAAPPPVATAPPSLTQEEWQAMQGLVSQGYPQEQVLRAIVAKRAGAPGASVPAAAAAPPPAAAPPAPAVAAPSAPSAKPKLSAAEVKEVQRLKAAGKSPAEIEHLIEAQRLFQQRFGLASPEATRQAVSQRNETGRWADEP